MQAVPSLVGTGTIVAAAAAGLVFSQPDEPSARRPISNKRKLAFNQNNSHLPASSFLRPGTSTASDLTVGDDLPSISFRQHHEPLPSPLSSNPTSLARPPRSSTAQLTPPKASSRRQSFIKQTDVTARPIAENPRDSISSNGSWIRRLSIRPLSQHGSPRSSIGPDSPSLFSHGSGAPILSPTGPATPQLPPNKLVKRGTSGQSSNAGTISRKGSRSQMPTLRRPATSHQRSATLQQFQSQGGFSGPPEDPKLSLDHQIRPRDFSSQPEIEMSYMQQNPTSWISFFQSRAIRTTGRRSSDNSSNTPTTNKRVQLRQGTMPRAYLTKPAALPAHVISPNPAYGPDSCNNDMEDSPDAKYGSPSYNSADETPTKLPRRSISMHFSSPSNWIPKTGSIRRSKRGSTEGKSGGKRQASAPAASSPTSDHQQEAKPVLDEIFLSYGPCQQLEPEPACNSHPKARKRHSSSPLPPLSRLSSFNIDVARLGLSTASSPGGPQRSTQVVVTPLSISATYSLTPKSRAVSGERASTAASSDLDGRAFMSEDDDDTDCRSDTMFDSFRTAASTRFRTVETPLESMFDESPPSTAGNGKTKRLSIQEILGRSWDGDTKIMEEDESLPTPIRASHTEADLDLDDRVEDNFSFGRESPDLSMVPRDFGRLSLDDDDDDDWARDDENALSNHLSPPSSAFNSRRASPNLRHALANISGNSSADCPLDGLGERPRSSIFDWREPSSHDKFDVDGHSPRPKTVHGKQEMDLRGGRPTNRKGPSAAHVRSQSVPVVPDPSDSAKAVPKFGTWGLGTKTVSEDWDDDFDFEEEVISPLGGKDSATSFSMVVPASIQATQPTVKAHSGQIREFSLLVNDLKRLCRHGKDLDILDGPSAAKWKEAHNIIELASPDEDDAEKELHPPEPATDPQSSPLGSSPVDERFLDEGFDGSALDYVDEAFSASDGEMSKIAVVRERPVVRRRSVFSPDDDIFGGNWPLSIPDRPRTPDQASYPSRDSAMISTVMEAMQQQRSTSDTVKRRSPVKPSQSKLFFDTNSLQELVKRAGQLRDSLSDIVRRAELLTQSPAGTPRRERQPRLSDGSPAFTRVFADPASSPPKRLPKTHGTNSGLSRTSVDSPRMQVMTVS